MFDIGWTELLLIGVVALIVVGPKDLPHLFHSLGRFTAKARGMAREFTSAMDEAARGSGLDEAAKTLNDVKSLTSKKSLGLDALDRAADKFEKWDPKISTSRSNAPVDPNAPQRATDAPPPPADPQPEAQAQVAAQPGSRRLHAVRRSDRKDN